jgi:hypothetical protein
MAMVVDPGRGALVVLGVAAVLSGCVGQSSDPGEGAKDETVAGLPETTVAWSMTGCKFGATFWPVPAASVTPFLPPGFRSKSIQEFVAEGFLPQADVPNPANDGNVGVEVFQCTQGVGLEGPLDGMGYASFYSGVEPPAELRRPGVSFYFVKWDTLIPDAPRRDLLASYGLPVHAGNTSVTVDVPNSGISTTFPQPVALAPATYDGRLEFGPHGGFTFSGRSGAPLPDGSFVEYMQTPGGLAEWSMAYSFRAGGAAAEQSVTVPAGSWFAEAFGEGEHDAQGFLGIIDFASGSLRIPAQPPANATAPPAP